jgi:phosphoribosylformylglycinamidine synthase
MPLESKGGPADTFPVDTFLVDTGPVGMDSPLYDVVRAETGKSGSSRDRSRRIIYDRFMKARVFVSPKTTVLDPQGQTIRGALNGLGHASIADVRQGKFFDVELTGGNREAAAVEMDQIARDVLSNPVIEDYRVEFFD